MTAERYAGILGTLVYRGRMASKVVDPKHIHSNPWMAWGTPLRIWQMAVTPVRLMPMDRYMPRLPVSRLV